MKNTDVRLIYSDLTHEIIGSLFEVFNNLGFGRKENIYQKALAQELSQGKINYAQQVYSKISYKGKTIGKYYFDFFIDDKVIVEIKVRNYFSIKDINQLYEYLKSSNLKLGIIAHFTKSGVKYKRVVNLY